MNLFILGATVVLIVFISVSGDEISSSCVNEFPRIKQWMKEKGMNTTSYSDLVKYIWFQILFLTSRYYESKLIDIVSKNGNKRMIFWQEIFEMFEENIHETLPVRLWYVLSYFGGGHNYQCLDKRTKSKSSEKHCFSRLSSSHFLWVRVGYIFPLNISSYLDQQIPNIDPTKTHYLWLDTWQDFYNNDPLEGLSDLPIEEQNLVLGGEAW